MVVEDELTGEEEVVESNVVVRVAVEVVLERGVLVVEVVSLRVDDVDDDGNNVEKIVSVAGSTSASSHPLLAGPQVGTPGMTVASISADPAARKSSATLPIRR